MMKIARWAVPALLLVAALLSYLAGATLPSMVLVALGVCLEMAFWVRLVDVASPSKEP
ncbi:MULTISPECIES: hypothetical protein [Shewanella]|uniref:hypothetical protein n=1 Tax=Shewanella TaxID=22 RepID=UPI001C65618F|nr:MULTISPECIES: hypothetical protein [Shewanella]QYJ74831.1 hypothetical protein K0H79_16005 [Shewanella sp. FJAT-52076]QYK04702.1 hypothetical protein K0H63_16855 [Shewanella zhangzhouensis]